MPETKPKAYARTENNPNRGGRLWGDGLVAATIALQSSARRESVSITHRNRPLKEWPLSRQMAVFLETCEQAARIGGKVLGDWQNRVVPHEKGPRDFVTQADLASQEAIKAFLMESFPDHAFLGEEDTPRQTDGALAPSTPAGYCWVVDPLDGTSNFLHGLPGFAVSIALLKDGQMACGTVFDPLLEECFSAEQGRGAFLNGKRLKTSGCKDLGSAMLSASFSPNVPRGSPEVARFVELLHEARALRRLGSAALNLCYVAAGRLDGYWATSVKIWDVAAGLLLVQEAGGQTSNLAGNPIDLADPKLVVSATDSLQQQLLAALSRAEAGYSRTP